MKTYKFVSANRTDYQSALHQLRQYFGLISDIDFIDALSKKKTATDFKEELPIKTEATDGEEEVITALFQHSQHAYFAHEIIDKLKEVDPADKSKSINVIYENDGDNDLKYGTSATIDEGEAGTRDPVGSASLLTSLKKYTAPLDIKQKGKGKVELAFNSDRIADINNVPKEPSKSDPALSAIISTLPTAQPTNRNGSGAALFLGHIPTLEMNRCVPHIEVSLVTQQPSLDSKNRLTGIGISRFLFGSKTIDKDGERSFIEARDARFRPGFVRTASGTNIKGTADLELSDSQSFLGMEGFTSPQTMVNADETFLDSGVMSIQRAQTVIDKFRPYMSLRDFKIDVVANVGLIQQKTASMAIILHDRSRLAEIAELVKIDMYNGTEIVVEYGWNHPDGISGNNQFGKFLNSLKVAEKYRVATSSYAFDEVGQVTINLKLSLLGQQDAGIIRVGDNEFNVSGVQAVAELERALSSFKKLYPKFGEQEGTKANVKPRQGAAASEKLYKFTINEISDGKKLLALDKKKIKQLRKFVKDNLNKKGDAGKLADILSTVFSNDTKDKNNLEQIRKSIRDSVAAKLDSIKYVKILETEKLQVGKDIKNNSVGPNTSKRAKKVITNYDTVSGDAAKGLSDPFHCKFTNEYLKCPSLSGHYEETNFGTLFMNFVARPLALSGRFDEVQVVFYTFNKEASYMANKPVSSFPIEIDKFADKYIAYNSLGASLNLYEFVAFINKEYVGNIAYKAYGFSSLYKYNSKEKNYETLKIYKDNSDLFNTDRGKTLADAYGQYAKYIDYVNKSKGKNPEFKNIPKFNFRQPRLSVQFECLPHHAKGLSKTILRIHVFDAAASENNLYEEVMRNSQADSFEAITGNFAQRVKDSGSQHRKEVYVNQINSLLKAKIIEVEGNSNIDEISAEQLGAEGAAQLRFVVKAGADAVKRACMREMSSLTYGSATTNIISANVSSNAVGGLFEINVLRSGLGHGRSPLGARDAGLPVELAPVQMSMTTMGFPFFFIGQEFFIDLNTGTTIDNIYQVMSISHSLSEGSFTTSIKLIPRYAYGKSKAISSMVSDAVQTIKATAGVK